MAADDQVTEPVLLRLTEQQHELLDALATELGGDVEDAVRYGLDAFLRQQP